MTVLRIVPDIAVDDPVKARAFYGDILGLDCAMDQGWVTTWTSPADTRPQVSFLTEGGSGQPVPRLSVEVDDLDAVLARAKAAGVTPDYGPATEPWGVRRAFLTDPFGNLVNVLTHI